MVSQGRCHPRACVLNWREETVKSSEAHASSGMLGASARLVAGRLLLLAAAEPTVFFGYMLLRAITKSSCRVCANVYLRGTRAQQLDIQGIPSTVGVAAALPRLLADLRKQVYTPPCMGTAR